MSRQDMIERSRRIGLTEIAPSLDYSNQTMFITGGADGIGAAVTRAAPQLGAHVIVLDVQEEKLKALQAELGERITTIPFDLSQTDQQAYTALAEKIVSASPSGKVDAYIVNAGVVKLSRNKGVEGVTGDEFRKVAQINAHSHADIYRALRASFALAADARIVITSSPIVGRGDPNTPAYALSKRMMETYGNLMFTELKDTGVTVTGYVPPPVQNFLRTDLKPNEPLHAHPHGEDIAEVPLRLASRELNQAFNGKVVVFGYDHRRDKSGKLDNGASYDFMPRDLRDNGFVYTMRLREFDKEGGDGGKVLRRSYSTAAMRGIMGLGRTPDMETSQSLGGIYETPDHVAQHRKPKP